MLMKFSPLCLSRVIETREINFLPLVKAKQLL
jgi:hypothetical protein